MNILQLTVTTNAIPLLVFKVMAVLCSSFLAITFLQSSFDKIFDYKGNLAYFRVQFGKSILKNMVGLLLPVLTVLEAATGLLCALGNVIRFFWHDALVMGVGLVV